MARHKQRSSSGAAWIHTGPVVDVHDVHLTYPGAPSAALAGVDVQVAPGEFVYLVGESGSGKSTLLRTLYAAERPEAGTVTVAGVELTRLHRRRLPDFRRRVGVVFQDYGLLPHKTVAENVAFALHVVGRRHLVPTRVPDTLALVGLAGKEDRMPGELSGGEQQRVALARAVVNRPVLLVADEPTGNLDPGTSTQVMAVLDELNRMGTTVVMATHDTVLVDQHRHRVVELAAGRVVRDDTTGGYRRGPALPTEAGLPSGAEQVVVLDEEGQR